MPRERSTEPSPPTMLKWLKLYHLAVGKLIEDGRLYAEEGNRVRKGLAYAIKALEDSYARYKGEKRRKQEDEYKKQKTKVY